MENAKRWCLKNDALIAAGLRTGTKVHLKVGKFRETGAIVRLDVASQRWVVRILNGHYYVYAHPDQLATFEHLKGIGRLRRAQDTRIEIVKPGECVL